MDFCCCPFSHIADHSADSRKLNSSLQSSTTSSLPLQSPSTTQGSKHHDVLLGNPLLPSVVSSRPDVIFDLYVSSLLLTPSPTIRANTTYTSILTDPDATSRSDPVKAEMCHWIVTDTYLPSSASGKVQTLSFPSPIYGAPELDQQAASKQNVTELISCLAPSPPPNTKYHHYVFVLLVSVPTDDIGREGGGHEAQGEVALGLW